MFLLNRKTDLVLMAIIGILLAPVFIQPAQGLQCYTCQLCGNSELGTIKNCSEKQKYCAWGEHELENGFIIARRGCADTELIEGQFKDLSCDEFKPAPPVFMNPKEKVRICHCQEDLCNKDDIVLTTTPSGASSFSSQLLLLSGLVSNSASRINW